jgi:hypothetical protein
MIEEEIQQLQALKADVEELLSKVGDLVTGFDNTANHAFSVAGNTNQNIRSVGTIIVGLSNNSLHHIYTTLLGLIDAIGYNIEDLQS